jgi:chromate transporter
VVGVILHLALVLGGHIFFPDGLSGAPEWAGLRVGLLATVALFRFRLGAVPVVAGGAGIGLLRMLLVS